MWKCGASRSLAIDDDDSWDGQAARDSIFSACGWPDNPRPAQARRYFLVYNEEAPTNKTGYKLPFAMHTDGSFKAVAGGIRAAASRLPQTDDLTDAVRNKARSVIDAYEARMNDEESAMSLAVDEAVLEELKQDPNADPREKMFRVCDLPLDVKSGEYITDGGVEWFKFSGWMTTRAQDSYGDVINPDGWNLKRFNAHPHLLLQHRPSDIIGRVNVVEHVKGEGLFSPDMRILATPWARQELIPKIQAGILEGMSVGFRAELYEPLDPEDPWGGYYIEKAELWENSVVTFPANPKTYIGQKMYYDALRRSAEGFGAVPAVPWQEVGGVSVPAASVQPTASVSSPNVMLTTSVGGSATQRASDEGGLVITTNPPTYEPLPESMRDHRQDDHEVGEGIRSWAEMEKVDSGDAPEDSTVSYLAKDSQGNPALRILTILPDAGCELGRPALDLSAVRESMGLVFTMKSGVDEPGRVKALETLTAIYTELGLALPDAGETPLVSDGVLLKFNEVTFHEGEAALVASRTMRGNLVAVTSGARHLAKHGALLDKDEDLEQIRECLVALLEVIPEDQRAAVLGGVTVLDDEPSDEQDNETTIDGDGSGEDVDGDDLKGFLASLGLDPDDPAFNEKVAELAASNPDALEALEALVGDLGT